jgi:hypothetical protein
MTPDELRRSKRDEILRIAATYGASNVRVVDVATEDMLRPKVRKRALLDAIPL